MARPKKYIIRLTEEERSLLDKTIRNKHTCKTVLRRCQILRELDEINGTGHTHQQIAHTYAVSSATVFNTIKLYMEKGIQAVIKYNISPNSSAALRKTDGRSEAKLIQIACGPAPQGHSRWTLRLLEEKARVELDVPISKDTIRRVLKKTNSGPTSTTTGASRQKRMRNS